LTQIRLRHARLWTSVARSPKENVARSPKARSPRQPSQVSSNNRQIQGYLTLRPRPFMAPCCACVSLLLSPRLPLTAAQGSARLHALLGMPAAIALAGRQLLDGCRQNPGKLSGPQLGGWLGTSGGGEWVGTALTFVPHCCCCCCCCAGLAAGGGGGASSAAQQQGPEEVTGGGPGSTTAGKPGALLASNVPQVFSRSGMPLRPRHGTRLHFYLCVTQSWHHHAHLCHAAPTPGIRLAQARLCCAWAVR